MLRALFSLLASVTVLSVQGPPSVRAVQLRSAVSYVLIQNLANAQWLQAFLPLRVASLALPAFLATVANTLCLQALSLQIAQVAVLIVARRCRHTCRIGRPGLAPLDPLPPRHSGIVLSPHLTARKFSPTLTILFNWLSFWLLLSRKEAKKHHFVCSLSTIYSGSRSRLWVLAISQPLFSA